MTLPQDFFPRYDRLAPADYARSVRGLLATTVRLSTVQVPLEEAAGRRLSTELRAAYPVPSFPNSQMDGYALTARGASRTERVFRVGVDVPAGADITGLPVNDSTVYPVMTGAPLPVGYKAVVPVEHTRVLGGVADAAGFALTGGQVEIPPTEIGSCVRQTGEDIEAGALLGQGGQLLTPALVGALAAQGIGQVPVHDRLRLLVITGGNEIAADAGGRPPAPGQIFDANGPLLTALAQQDNCTVHRLGTNDSVPDFLTGLTQAIRGFAPHLVVTSGGISHGKYEVVRLALTSLMTAPTEGLGVAAAWFGHLAQQPGGPQGLALLDTGAGNLLPVLCLPGNPVSTLISYHLLIRPALATLAGGESGPLLATLATNEPIVAPVGKTQYRRASLTHRQEPEGVRLLVKPDPATGSHLLHRAAAADVLVELEPGITYSGGETVRYLPL